MLHKIGTLNELHTLKGKINNDLYSQIELSISILNKAYGADRDYNTVGGFVLVVDELKDVSAAAAFINADTFEWIEEASDDYISSLFLLGDDFSIIVFINKEVIMEIIKYYINKENYYENC